MIFSNLSNDCPDSNDLVSPRVKQTVGAVGVVGLGATITDVIAMTKINSFFHMLAKNSFEMYQQYTLILILLNWDDIVEINLFQDSNNQRRTSAKSVRYECKTHS